MTMPAAADPVLLHAAGSLRLALTEVIAAYEPAAGVKVQAEFGASGTLKDAIAKGERAEVFASANMEHPQALADAKKSGPVVLFARNRLCALVRPGLAGHAGDAARPHARSGGEARDLDAEGGPVRRLCLGGVPQGRQAQARLVRDPREARAAAHRRTDERRAAEGPHRLRLARRRRPRRHLPDLLHQCDGGAGGEPRPADSCSLPDTLAVGADYGMTVMTGASPAAYRFAMFILSAAGQRILAKHGFTAPGLPQ